MQDAIAAEAVSVQSGHNKVALFANPYREGKTEALIINSEGLLSYLHRSGSATGWDQAPVTAGHPNQIPASEVVVVLYQGDLSVWAIFIDAIPNQRKPHVLKLVASSGPGETICSWETLGNVPWQAGDLVSSPGLLHVYYEGPQPWVTGVDKHNGNILMIRAAAGAPEGSTPFFGVTTKVSAGTGVDEIVAGYRGGAVPSLVVYARTGRKLIRHDIAGNTTTEVSAEATKLAGAYPSPNLPDIGCVFLDAAGNLVTCNKTAGFGPLSIAKEPGLGYVTATSWVDAHQHVHVFGLDSARTLKVLHQVRWHHNGLPSWSRAETTDGKTTAACLSLLPSVAGFTIDPLPSLLPSQLLKAAGTPVPSEQFSFCTQDITTTRWSQEKIKLPTGGTAHMATRYVSDVTVLDQRGAVMPGQLVSVSAESLVEIAVDGAWYLVGPGYSAQVTTGPFGRITISAPADTLTPATVRVDAAGLENGAVIQQAAAVHDYLAGTGTLPSQKGTFDKKALSDAKVGGVPIVPGSEPERDAKITAVVHTSKLIFDLADGKPLTSRHYQAADAAPVIYGAAIGPDPGRSRTDGQQAGELPVGYYEFAAPADAAAHIQAIRERDDYGGIWEDFARWASDVWEGIKSGVTEVFQVVVTETVKIFIYIGNKIVELIDIVVDTFESVMRAIEAAFRQAVKAIGDLIDWLKALFRFDDIIDTADVFEDIVKKGPDYLAHQGQHLKDLGHNWFSGQKEKVHEALTALRNQYADDARLGDFQNQAPSIPGAEPNGTPQSNWLLNQVVSPRATAAIDAPDELIAIPEAILEAFQDLWDGASAAQPDQPPISEIARGIEDIQEAMSALFSGRDDAAKMAWWHIIDALDQFAGAFLDFLDNITRLGANLIIAFADGLHTLLDQELNLGSIVADLWRWMHTQASRPVPKMTFRRFLAMLAAFPATITYKLIMGVDNPPFPGAETPPLPPPGGALAATDNNLARDYTIVQIAGCAAGFLTSALDVASDWPYTPPQYPLANVIYLLDGGLGTLVSFLWMPLFYTNGPMEDGSEPSVYWGNWTPGIVSYLSTIVTTVAGIRFGGNSKPAKRFGEGGSICCTALGAIELACGITAAVREQGTPRDIGCVVTGSLLDLTSFWFIIADRVKNATASAAMYGAKAVFDGGCDLASLILWLVETIPALDGISIDTASLTPYAAADCSYQSRIRASTSEPPVTWALSGPDTSWEINPAPDDQQAGIVTGTPGSAGTVTLTISATNSWYPAFSDSQTCSVTVLAAVPGIDPGNGDQQTKVGTDFQLPLRVTVTAAQKPLAGVAVTFTAPDPTPAGHAASGTFRAGNGPSTSVTVSTDTTGIATAPTFSANGTPGTYQVTMSVPAFSARRKVDMTNVARPLESPVSPRPGR